MKIFKCKLDKINQEAVGFHLQVQLIDNHHPEALAEAGEFVITSAVKMIDFERGFALTRNNIYKWKD